MEDYIEIFIWNYVIIGSLAILALLIWLLINAIWLAYQAIKGTKKVRQIIRFYRENHTDLKVKKEDIIK